MREPTIGITCDCGESHSVAYGDRWQCENCGRNWDTGQIPTEEYRRLSRAIRRYQLESLAFAAIMLAIFVPLMVIVDVRLGITGLIVFFAWALLLRPRQRRRLLESTRGAARWKLKPE